MDNVSLKTTSDNQNENAKASEKYAGLKKRSKESNALVKECIKTALIALSATKDYTDISVTELCKKAGVSRMAFYRNYSIIGDILREIAIELSDDILRAVGSPFASDTNEAWYIMAFRHIQTHKDIMNLMLKENFQRQWMDIINKIAIHNSLLTVEQKYQRLMWCGGFENAVAYWLNNNLKETPDEMAEYCMKYLPKAMNTES